MINFGAGKIIAVPTNLADGTAIAVPQPVVLGILQEVSLDLSVDVKKLYGAAMYPVAVAQGKGSISLKAKYADISAAILGSLFFGQAATAAIKAMVTGIAGVVPGTPFQLTPAVPSSGAWVGDLGVFNADDGSQYVRVASSPTTGQYSVSAGVYTFAAADVADNVLFSFEYSATSSSASLFTINNRDMGYTPSFAVMLQGSYDGKKLTAKFYRGVSSKLALPFKNEDFAVPDFDADFFANSAGQVGWICLH